MGAKRYDRGYRVQISESTSAALLHSSYTVANFLLPPPSLQYLMLLEQFMQDEELTLLHTN
jgi:hypothetical protein